MARLKFMFLQYEDIPDDIKQSLWDQLISLDDIDYMLITKDIDQFSELNDDSVDHNEAQRLVPSCYDIERLINRADKNKWYKAIIYDKVVAVGIAYHA